MRAAIGTVCTHEKSRPSHDKNTTYGNGFAGNAPPRGGGDGGGVLICCLLQSFDHWPRIPSETEALLLLLIETLPTRKRPLLFFPNITLKNYC